MEADWSAEIGPGLAHIDASWQHFVDLRESPRSIDEIGEAAKHPALRAALLSLNAEDSPVFTTKCDVWPLAEEIDPYEFGAGSEEALAGFAAYIDLIERRTDHFISFEFHEQRARELTSRLRLISTPPGRVDLVVRAAAAHGQNGYGLTFYAAGCGVIATQAYAAWEAVLATAVAATISAAHPPCTGE